MKYNSTRGGVKGVSFESALFSGYAADGGLFVPESVPKLDKETLKEWKALKLTYPEVVRKIFRLYVSSDEISDEGLEVATTNAYNSFYKKEVVSIQEVQDENGRKLKIAELFHGRTGAFKDLSMSLVGQLMQHFMTKNGRHVTVLVETTGDTGPAAISSICSLSSVDIIVLYPLGMISEVQEIQMKSATEDNVHVYGVEGTADDLDLPIEKCFPREGLMSINSINWARILIQISHYVYLYLLEEFDEPIHVVVPSGAGGNLSAGVYAIELGIPIHLYATTNHNDCLSVLLTQGKLCMGKSLVPSVANAMDSGNPYNLERILCLCGADAATITTLMTTAGNQEIPDEIFKSIQARIRGSGRVNDEHIFETILSIWEHNKYPICPHTATGVKFFTDTVSADIPETSTTAVYVLATASPFKFQEVIKKAGLPEEWSAGGSEFTDALKGLKTKEPKLMKRGEDWYQILQDQISAIEARRSEASAPSDPAEVSLGDYIINSTEAQDIATAEPAKENPAEVVATSTKKNCTVL